MPIIVYGLNHTSAPVELRERVVVPAETLVDAVGRLLRFDGIEEGLILSTCNRTELLVNAREETTREQLREFLTVERGVDPAELDRHCYVHLNRDAVRHLFRVASSLDSMILGEPQILGQMKEAYATATSAGAVKGTLDSLIRRAFSVAKKVRTETGIARSAVSISVSTS